LGLDKRLILIAIIIVILYLSSDQVTYTIALNETVINNELKLSIINTINICLIVIMCMTTEYVYIKKTKEQIWWENRIICIIYFIYLAVIFRLNLAEKYNVPLFKTTLIDINSFIFLYIPYSILFIIHYYCIKLVYVLNKRSDNNWLYDIILFPVVYAYFRFVSFTKTIFWLDYMNYIFLWELYKVLFILRWCFLKFEYSIHRIYNVNLPVILFMLSLTSLYLNYVLFDLIDLSSLLFTILFALLQRLKSQ